MDNSRDSSVWRSLAVALGDGLAFGVGMALSQKASRREAAPQPEIGAAGERLQELERRMSLLESAPVRLDPKVLETIVGVFEADLRERDEQWSRRLATAVESSAASFRQEHASAADSHRLGLAAALRDREEQWNRRLAAAIESAVSALRQEHTQTMTALRHDVVADLRTLESQGIAWQQELTETLPRMMDERIAGHLDAAALDAAIDRKLDAYRTELEGRDREIAELRDRLTASEQRTLDLLTAIGQACRETAERMNPAPAPCNPTPEARAESPVAENVQPNEGTPRFEVQSAPKWNLPMVSSLLVALSGCFVCLHWV